MNVPSSRFRLIQSICSDPDNHMSVSELCALNNVSRSGYYNWLKQEEARRAREEQDRKDFELILGVFTYKPISKRSTGHLHGFAAPGDYA